MELQLDACKHAHIKAVMELDWSTGDKRAKQSWSSFHKHVVSNVIMLLVLCVKTEHGGIYGNNKLFIQLFSYKL